MFLGGLQVPKMTSKEVSTSESPVDFQLATFWLKPMVLQCFKDALFWISDQSRKRTQKNSSLFLNVCINVQDSNMGTRKFVVYMVLNHPFWEHCNLNNFEHISAITGLLPTFYSLWMVCSPNMTQGDPLRTLPSWKLETSPISEAAPNDSGTGSVDV